jgi:hypothetical protein
VTDPRLLNVGTGDGLLIRYLPEHGSVKNNKSRAERRAKLVLAAAGWQRISNQTYSRN